MIRLLDFPEVERIETLAIINRGLKGPDHVLEERIDRFEMDVLGLPARHEFGRRYDPREDEDEHWISKEGLQKLRHLDLRDAQGEQLRCADLLWPALVLWAEGEGKSLEELEAEAWAAQHART